MQEMAFAQTGSSFKDIAGVLPPRMAAFNKTPTLDDRSPVCLEDGGDR